MTALAHLLRMRKEYFWQDHYVDHLDSAFLPNAANRDGMKMIDERVVLLTLYILVHIC